MALQPSTPSPVYDTEYHFMLVEVKNDALNVRAINQDGSVVDSGMLPRVSDQDKKRFASGTWNRAPLPTNGGLNQRPVPGHAGRT